MKVLTVKDWKYIKEMCEIQCTQEEIAAAVGMCLDTLQYKCTEENGVNFSEYFGQKRQGGKCSLRRKQWKMADKSAAMAIFLGKQYLEQKDQIHTEHSTPEPLRFEFIEVDENTPITPPEPGPKVQ